MAVQAISFNDSVLNWVKSEATRTGHNVSFMVNFFCQEAMEKRKKEKPQMLECPKHPGTSYSSRLSECPLCAEQRTISEIEARDSMIVFERKRLSGLITEKQAAMNKLTEEINALDPETDEQGKRDKLLQEFDSEAAELRQLKDKLQELV